MEEIKELWFEGMVDSCNPHRFKIGVNGVTQIECVTYQGDRGGFVTFFRVKAGDKVIADIYNPSGVYYED